MSTAASQIPSDRRVAIVVMGVAGSGKTTFGQALSKALGAPFLDGDDLHSPEARAKMSRGVALDDQDRAPWLDRIGAALGDRAAYPEGAVVACSALRRVYRDRLRARAGPSLRFIFLKGDKALMRSRVANRQGHYMPASLIDSQFATLESPEGEPDVMTSPRGRQYRAGPSSRHSRPFDTPCLIRGPAPRLRVCRNGRRHRRRRSKGAGRAAVVCGRTRKCSRARQSASVLQRRRAGFH